VEVVGHLVVVVVVVGLGLVVVVVEEAHLRRHDLLRHLLQERHLRRELHLRQELHLRRDMHLRQELLRPHPLPPLLRRKLRV